MKRKNRRSRSKSTRNYNRRSVRRLNRRTNRRKNRRTNRRVNEKYGGGEGDVPVDDVKAMANEALELKQALNYKVDPFLELGYGSKGYRPLGCEKKGILGGKMTWCDIMSPTSDMGRLLRRKHTVDWIKEEIRDNIINDKEKRKIFFYILSYYLNYRTVDNINTKLNEWISSAQDGDRNKNKGWVAGQGGEEGEIILPYIILPKDINPSAKIQKKNYFVIGRHIKILIDDLNKLLENVYSKPPGGEDFIKKSDTSVTSAVPNYDFDNLFIEFIKEDNQDKEDRRNLARKRLIYGIQSHAEAIRTIRAQREKDTKKEEGVFESRLEALDKSLKELEINCNISENIESLDEIDVPGETDT